MGYYEVYLSDGVNRQVSIFDAGVKELALLNAVVSLGVNEAGSFEFTIPPQHVFYNNIIPYGSSIEVRENNETIFFGRPLPPTIDFWGNKKFHCEGALAFLNDVYLPPVNELSDEVEFNTLMDMVLGQYNRLQIRYDRQFAYDTDNFPSTMIYDPEEWNYQSVLDYIRNYMHQFVGGYFYAEWQSGLLELKWRQKLTDWSNQPITFGANLLEIMRVGQPFYTAAIAKGGEDIDGNTAAMLTPFVMSETARRKYGTITAYLDRPSATVVDALEAYCEAYLEDQQFNGVSFEISAADQHLLNGEYDEYRVGQQVHVISPDQDVDVVLPITQIKIDINSAIKKPTVGDLAIMPITISQKKAEKEAEKKTKETAKKESEKGKEDSNDSLVIKGADGNDYEIGVDENGEVIATKIPTSIELSPSSKQYAVSQSLNLSDFTVTAHYGDGTTADVTSSCTFNMTDGYTFVNNDTHHYLVAMYKVGGKTFADSSRLTTTSSGTYTVTFNSMGYSIGVSGCPADTKGCYYVYYGDGGSGMKYWPNIVFFSSEPFTDPKVVAFSGPTGNQGLAGSGTITVDGETVYYLADDIDGNYETNSLGWPVMTISGAVEMVYRYAVFPDGIVPDVPNGGGSGGSGSSSGSGYSDDSGGSESGGGGHF